MAYILGFFAADGYITVNRRGGQFWCLDIGDKKLIRQIKKTIGSDHKISVRKSKDRANPTYRLQIGGIEMCDDLRRLGFKERKTKSLAVPNVPEKYFCDFVRGYFDGDGNVWVGAMNKERKTPHFTIQIVFTSCSKIFLELLRKNLEYNGVDNGRLNKVRGNCYRLVYSVFGSLNLYKFMYNSQCVRNKLFLNRKKIIFEKFIKMRS